MTLETREGGSSSLENLNKTLKLQLPDELVILHRRRSRRAFRWYCLRHLKRLPIEDWDIDSYVFTNRRVICERNGQIDELPLEKISHINTTVGLVGKLLGFGNVLIEAEDRSPLSLEMIDNPPELEAVIREAQKQVAAAQAGVEYKAYSQIVASDLAPEKTVLVFRKHPFYLLKTASAPIVGVLIGALLLAGGLLHQVPDFVRTGNLAIEEVSGLVTTVALIWLVVCLFWLWFKLELWRKNQLVLSTNSLQIRFALPLGLYEHRAWVSLPWINRVLITEDNAGTSLWNSGSVSIEKINGDQVEFTNFAWPERCRHELHMLLFSWARRRLEVAEAQTEPQVRQFALNRFLHAIARDWVEDIELPDQIRLASAVHNRTAELPPEYWAFDLPSTWISRNPTLMWLIRNRLEHLGLTSRFVAATQIAAIQWEAAGMLTNMWTKCLADDNNADFLRCFSDLYEQIAGVIGATVVPDSFITDPTHNFLGRSLDVSDLFQDLDLRWHVSIVFIRSPRFGDSELDTLRQIIETLGHNSGKTGGTAIVISIDTTTISTVLQRFLDERLRQPYAIDTLLLSYRDLLRIALSNDPKGEFRRKLLSCMSLSALSPSVFVITGPVRDSSFFGREQEMRTIVEHAADTTFAVIGGRRIGKTSLLRRLHRVRLPAAGFSTAYHDCSTTPDIESFRNAVLDNWQPRPPSTNHITFSDISAAWNTERRLVLLLDEADELVASDRSHGWPLFKELRALTNSARVQMVFSGERALRDALRDSSGPMYNLANEVLLGPLDYRATHELITRPMKQLGVELADETAVVEAIWNLTSGHPNVVQRLCRRLIVSLGQRDSRHLALSDIREITEDPAFQRDDFLATYWQRATPLEKILSLILVDEIRPCSLSSIRVALHSRCGLNPKAQNVDAALQRLVDLRSLLRNTPRGYEFAVPAFPPVVGNTVTLFDMLEVLIEEYQELGE